MDLLPRTQFLLFSLVILCFSSCTERGCSNQGNINAQTNGEEHAKIEQDQKISEFAGLNLAGLKAEQKNELIKLLNDEICPCGCPKTFAQCLVRKKECEPGQMLAQWAADQLKAGAPERTLLQVLSEEINNGYMSKQNAINTENAFHKGNKNAPITIVEFADFECPACKMAAKAMKKLLKDKGDEINLYFMHFPLTVHPQAEAAAVAAEAAGLQGKFWEMHDLLFEHEGPLTETVIEDLGKKLFKGKELARFNEDRKDTKLLDKVRANKEYAMTKLRLMSTPSFFFNGRLYNLSLAEDGFLLRIAMERARVGIDCQPNQK